MFKFLRKTEKVGPTKEIPTKKRVNFQTEIAVEVVDPEPKNSRRTPSSVSKKVPKRSGRFWLPTKVFAALKLSRRKRKNSTKLRKRNSHRTSQKKKRKSESF